jgi:hypothetical protein
MNSLENFAKFIPITNNVAFNQTLVVTNNILTDVEAKARKMTNSLNESLYEVANEPSLGLFRIQVNFLNISFNKSFSKLVIV